MYDHDREDIDVLGLEEFILRQWESLFLGYRSSSVRTIARRWCDLLEAGLGCSQDLADELVRNEIVGREDRHLFGARDSTALLEEMTGVLEGFADALIQMPQIPADQLADLLKRHARLVRVVTGEAEDDEEEATSGASASS